MKNWFLKYFGLLLCCSLFACKKSESTVLPAPENAVDFKTLVTRWNAAHSLKNIADFDLLFDRSVLFYGNTLSKSNCVEKKTALLKRYPDFKQQLRNDLEIANLDDGTVKCSFTKNVSFNNQEKEYPSYLVFKQYGTGWKIITESDYITDKNLAKKTQTAVAIPENAIKGDFNGDGKQEYMWLVPPKISDTEMDCVGDCISYIKFSDSSIPDIKIESAIGGIPVNEGDLNRNGTDEIGLLPDWFTSCWRSYYVWTLKNGQWIYAVKPFPTHCMQWEEEVVPVEIDKDHKGHVLIRYSELTDTDIVTRTKSVSIE